MVNDNADATCNSEDQATGFLIQSDGGARDGSSEPSSKKQKLDAIAIKVSQTKTIMFQLKRLSLASGKDILDLYKSIFALV